MRDFLAPLGVASGILDFTDGLSVLLIGLVGLVWLSVGMIVFVAIRHSFSQRTQPAARRAPDSRERQKAA